jgi:hypothetical protein
MDSTSETWKPVVGYEGSYEVSDQGRVRSLDRFVITRGGVRKRTKGKTLRTSVMNTGYLQVSLGRAKTVTVHRLVLEAFVGPAPEGSEACHYPDPDRSNSALSNLRWGTRSDNIRDCIEHGHHVMTNRLHCPRGHEYTESNTYIGPSGSRFCRECRNAHGRRLRAERRAIS